MSDEQPPAAERVRAYNLKLQQDIVERAVGLLKRDIELRKWCVEHATPAMSAAETFAFVTEGLNQSALPNDAA